MVPCRCITEHELRLFQCTAIGELTHLHFPAADPEQTARFLLALSQRAFDNDTSVCLGRI